MFRFKSSDENFFKLYEEAADIIYQSALLLKNMTFSYEDAEKRLGDIVVLDQKEEKITDTIIDKLNGTFITPFDREDIYSLARELNEIQDSISSTIEKMIIYETGKPKQRFIEMVEVLVDATEKIRVLINYLRKIKKNPVQIMELCYEIKKCESDGDKIYRYGISDLFKNSKDVIFIIKWKEVFEQLETTLDRCERIAKLIRGVVVKYV